MKQRVQHLALILTLISLVSGLTTLPGCAVGNTPDKTATKASDSQPADPSISEHNSQPGIWYEIFVRSFADSNGDGIGDINGITARLDYLNDGNPLTSTDLGVNGIWLMPIMPSPSYHGYDVTDYYTINPAYGNLTDFENLVRQASKRGISIIIDLVINHTSTGHPWFREASSNTASTYRDYYHWFSAKSPGYNLKESVWGHPVWNLAGHDYYYALFWDQMPDLNFDNPRVRQAMIEIAGFWLQKGVAGFRLDAAMHIYGQGESPAGTDNQARNLAWWAEFATACRKVNPDVYLVGEIWDSTARRAAYAGPFDTTFDFDIAEGGIVKMVQAGSDLNGKQNGLADRLQSIYKTLAQSDPTFIDAPFLSNHDQRRAMDYFAPGDTASMRLAAGIYLTLPGNPFIYYGEELGMLGDKPDERIREPFIWGQTDPAQTTWESISENTATIPASQQLADEHSLLADYRRLIRLRQGHPALQSGDFSGLDSGSRTMVTYRRSAGGETVYVIHNLAKSTQRFELSRLGSPVSKLLYAGTAFIYNGESVVEIPPQTTLVFQSGQN